MADVLPKIHISGKLILVFVNQITPDAGIRSGHIVSPCLSSVTEPVKSGKARELGLPTVQMCAGEVCLSPNYFGDLIKKELGRTAQEYIRHYVIDRAKELIAENEMNVSEVAYELGFKYPHHLTRVFKKVTGITPNEFRLTVN